MADDEGLLARAMRMSSTETVHDEPHAPMVSRDDPELERLIADFMAAVPPSAAVPFVEEHSTKGRYEKARAWWGGSKSVWVPGFTERVELARGYVLGPSRSHTLGTYPNDYKADHCFALTTDGDPWMVLTTPHAVLGAPTDFVVVNQQIGMETLRLRLGPIRRENLRAEIIGLIDIRQGQRAVPDPLGGPGWSYVPTGPTPDRALPGQIAWNMARLLKNHGVTGLG